MVEIEADFSEAFVVVVEEADRVNVACCRHCSLIGGACK
jgi:hypothetical protein